MENNENLVDVQTLSEHFSEEEIKAVLPQEPAAETPAPEAPTEPTTEPSQAVGDTDSKLKPTVIPYDRFKEVNEKNKLLAAELAAIKAQQQEAAQRPAPPPVQQAPPQVDAKAERARYYAMLSDAAEKEAREIHGIDATEDISTLQFTDQRKYQTYMNTMQAIVQTKDAENRQVMRLQQENEKFISYLQQDPLFPKVLQYSAADLENLPNKEAKAVDAAAGRLMQKRGTPDDFKLIEKTIQTYKQKFLSLNGQVEQPASPPSPLERAADLPRAGALSGNKSSAMSWAQVEGLIREGKIDQIPKEMIRQIDPRLLE
jgi:hypothetical protein